MAQTTTFLTVAMRRALLDYLPTEENRMPEDNPKAARAVADGKAPLDYLEPICDAGEARVLAAGAAKYGRRNFRDPDTVMLWSTYLGSMRRHLNALHMGEDIDPDTGEQHLAHIRANTAVLLAADDAGVLVDDRLDTTVTDRSRAVHEGGDRDAKADNWRGVSPNECTLRDQGCGGATCGACKYAQRAVEPFVVKARCCWPGGALNENCIPSSSSACDGLSCVMGSKPVFG